MTRAGQKHDEIFYAGDFLRRQLDLNVAELKPAIQEPPDCSATIANADGTTTRLDLEIVEYYVDNLEAASGGSSVKQIKSCWDNVLASLDPQLETLRLPVDVHVRLKEPISLKHAQVNDFANELIRFAQEFDPKRHLLRTTHEVFSSEQYPLLHELVERVDVTHLDDTVVLGWQCTNVAAAHVGVIRAHLADLIRRKSAKSFAWGPEAEKCLLIYASGETVTSRAGPPPPDPSIWEDERLITACKISVFDRIYFWELVRKWHKRLK